MNKSTFLNSVSRFHKGRFVRVHYMTVLDDDMRASMRPLYQVTKETMNTFKYGVKLANVKRYQAREAARTEPKKVYKQWAEWEVENVLKKNINTGRLYASFVTLPKNSNAKTQYFVIERDTGKTTQVTKEQLRASGLMRDSYWNKQPSETVLIPIENIFNIY